MKKEINVFNYADQIVRQLQQGVLLISHAEGKTNAMTISWGALGIDFGEPVFTTYVRSGRFTRELIDKSGEFTVAVPLGDNPVAKKALGFCGSRTGREIDKLKEAGLTTVEPEVISTTASDRRGCRPKRRRPRRSVSLPARSRRRSGRAG